MAYRQFSTGTWQDPWFEKLNTKARMLFVYLWTNDVCNQAGLYQISRTRIEFEVGFKVDEVLQNDLKRKISWFEEHEIVWVKNFFKWQCQNPRFAIAAIRSLASIPKVIVEQFIEFNRILIEKYGIDTVSIPYAYETEVETTVSLSVTKQKLNRTVTKQVEGFEDFWKAYPKKVGKVEAIKAWQKANGSRPPLEVVIAKINQLKKTDQWTKEKMQFCPFPATWLNRGGWDDEVPELQVQQQSLMPRN